MIPTATRRREAPARDQQLAWRLCGIIWLRGDADISEAGGGSQEFDGLKPTDSLEPVADRVGGWRARRVVAGPALNQIGLVGVAEEDEGGTIVGGLAVTGNLPSFLQQDADRRRLFGRSRGVNRQCK